MMDLLRSMMYGIISMWKTAAYGLTSLFMPSRWAAIPRKLAQITLPTIVAIIVFLLLIAVAVSWRIYLGHRPDTYETPWFGRLPLIIALIIILTMITYYTVKLWIEGEGSPFEDIDRAWQAGVEALEKHHFDLRQIPIFVVLGSEGPDQNRVLFNAARVGLTVDNVPPGPAALHWYANQDAIYLVCTEVGCISRLAQYAKEGGVTAAGAAPIPTGAVSRSATMMPSQELMEAAQSMSPGGGDGVDGNDQGSLVVPASSSMDIRGTMMVSSVDVRETIRPTAAIRSTGKSLELNREQLELQRARLAYLCKLLERNRRPLCGVNGVMTLVPIRLITTDTSEGAWTKEAIRNDLDALIAGMKLRFPVVAMVTGLEEEKGFDELIRRVGRERALGQRFGKGFGVWDPPIDEEIEALCKHACGAFEDWAYYLFKEPNSLAKPGNRALYMLLCKVRRILQPRLEKILIGGYSIDPETQPHVTPILFSGCYFAGTGETPERQAFVKGVFERLPEQQEELEWTEAALREEQFYRTWSTIAFSTAALLLIAVGFLGWRLYTGEN